MSTTTGPAVHRHTVTGTVTQHTSTPQSGDSIFPRNIGKLDRFLTVSTPKSATDINRSVSPGVRNLFLFPVHEDACPAVPWHRVCGKHA